MLVFVLRMNLFLKIIHENCEVNKYGLLIVFILWIIDWKFQKLFDGSFTSLVSLKHYR